MGFVRPCMRRIFWGFLLFIAAEIALLLHMVALVGGLWVLAALVAGVVLGRHLLAGISLKSLRQQGFGPLPAGRLITHVVAGVMFIVPGFITDLFALCLLLPFTAPWLQAQWLRRFAGQASAFNPAPKGQVFEGEFQRESPSKTPLPPSF